MTDLILFILLSAAFFIYVPLWISINNHQEIKTYLKTHKGQVKGIALAFLLIALVFLFIALVGSLFYVVMIS